MLTKEHLQSPNIVFTSLREAFIPSMLQQQFGSIQTKV